MLTRRGLLAGSASALLAAPAGGRSRLSMEGYIWNQYVARQKKSLAEGIGEALPMARAAGFANIELNQTFFTPEVRPLLPALLRANRLSMPSVYVGGAMHLRGRAEETIQRALDVAAFSKPFGCGAMVNNPDPLPAGAAKSDAELDTQAGMLNEMGRQLDRLGLEFRVHHHNPEMAGNAREWRHILKNTDPKHVSLCIDLDWAYQGGQDPLAILREAGARASELHLRNSRAKLWLESFEDGDIDYRKVAAHLKLYRLNPLLVVELAYRPETAVTRPLVDDLRLSREYAERIFAL
ncbi:MAG: TIM barrel protein [Acidobacteriia bacterium]|nr:TIM barrel protein [Terriglobia bacterium]